MAAVTLSDQNVFHVKEVEILNPITIWSTKMELQLILGEKKIVKSSFRGEKSYMCDEQRMM